MSTTTVVRSIAAPVADVFDAAARIQTFSQVVPAITNVEFLGEQTEGVGTRFRETRRMGKREIASTLEVTEFVVNERARFVSDEGGTVWDTVFTFEEAEGGTRMTLVMEGRPYKLMAKIINPLIRGMIQKAVAGDMDAIKAWCEAE